MAPKEKVGRLVEYLGTIENTIQSSWLIEMCQRFFGLKDDAITGRNWEALYDRAAAQMAQPDWAAQVLEKSGLEAVFLTNDFDDPLQGFDTSVYVPCLRTDDLVFHLGQESVRARLEKASGTSPHDPQSLRSAIGKLFEHFTKCGARACAVSLPPDFSPAPVTASRAGEAFAEVWRAGTGADVGWRRELSNFVFWTLAEFCAEFKLPFDLMIGVNRSVYADGVHQGRDLYDSRVSLIQYRELFNAFPQVMFPISVLASVTNQELVSYSWIFPNVLTNGHWWYSNTPTYIEHDAAPGSKRCRAPSRSATTATCTSSSSRCRNSPCTSGSWPRSWPSGLSSTAAGAKSARWPSGGKYCVTMWTRSSALFAASKRLRPARPPVATR